ncbi:MAG: peptidoglycan editing factor PgeF [Chloroflexota bacterium]|nr:peptidoglycan editing factor PgeF [Chloroflexota bacterium]
MTATSRIPSARDLRERLWQASNLSSVPGICHGATGRVPGSDLAEGNIGYGPPRDRDLAWAWRQRWAAVIGIEPERLVAARQIHGTAVLRVVAADAGRGAHPGSEPAGTADALVTDVPGLPLLSLHADCQPIFFVDPERRVVAIAHAGWRGVVADIAAATVRAMRDQFGTDPATLQIGLGPAISGGRYQVGLEVMDAWRATAGELAEAAITTHGTQFRFDISAANRSLLVRAGVPPENIVTADVCTATDGDRWFSHRGQGPTTGRFGAIISLAGEGTSG